MLNENDEERDMDKNNGVSMYHIVRTIERFLKRI